MRAVDLPAILHQTFVVTLKLGAPGLIAGLVVGLIVSLAQAVTQINEATIAFVPKLLAIGAVLMLSGPFMAGTLKGFAHFLFDQLILVGGS
jgi:flagellar biosynthetic protein FliQ